MHLRLFVSLFVSIILFIVSCQEEPGSLPTDTGDAESHNPWFGPDFAGKSNGHKIVVANRGSGTISVIDTRSDEVTSTYDLSGDAATAEPMYVVYNRQNHTVFVGDRANSRIAALDADDFSVKAYIGTGSGVFHMWADPQGKQLWVNNDIDNTITVIDPSGFSVISTIDIPADLAAMGGKPHDVVLDPYGRSAFISVLGLAGNSDYIVKYSTRSFTETGRAAVGKDPHLSLTKRNKLLYVPCQNNDAVFVLNRRSMNIKKIIDLPGAHGAGIATNGRTFYTTNLTGGGTEGLWAIDTRRNRILGNINTPHPVPHNIALTANGKKLYLTHSGGTADQLSVYQIDKRSRIPEYVKTLTVGLNPFGLAFVK